MLLSSTGLAAVLILRAGGMTGCGGPASPPPPQPASPAQPPVPDAAKTASAHQTAPPAVQAANAANPAPQPATPPAESKAADSPEPRNLEVGKNYFPASKAGPAIHPEPFLEPAREPAVLQQAPQPQQVAPQ